MIWGFINAYVATCFKRYQQCCKIQYIQVLQLHMLPSRFSVFQRNMLNHLFHLFQQHGFVVACLLFRPFTNWKHCSTLISVAVVTQLILQHCPNVCEDSNAWQSRLCLALVKYGEEQQQVKEAAVVFACKSQLICERGLELDNNLLPQVQQLMKEVSSGNRCLRTVVR